MAILIAVERFLFGSKKSMICMHYYIASLVPDLCIKYFTEINRRFTLKLLILYQYIEGNALGDAKQIIEINGKKYNIATGHVVNTSDNTQPKPIKQPPTPGTPRGNGAIIDGFVRRPKPTPSHKSVKDPAKSSTFTPKRAAKASRVAQKSKTLMRPGLKKPEYPAQTKQAKPIGKAALVVSNAEREGRAKHTPKSSHISKFSKGLFRPKKVVKRSSELPVATPAKVHNPSSKPATKQFEKAMHGATSHLETFVPNTKTKARKLLISGAAVVSVIVCGFLAFQMIPAIKVKFAGTRAGFSASLPSYSPAGFGLSGNIASSSGEVTLTYKSRTDDKNYKLSQTPSNWTSQALLNNFVIPANKPYQTYEDQGKTVYIYDNSNATWVDGGVWYKLEGNASLTSDQLLRIANGV